MTPHAEKFAAAGSVPPKCSRRAALPESKSIGFGRRRTLVLANFSICHLNGMRVSASQHDVCGKVRIVANKLAVSRRRLPGVDCAFGIAEPIKLCRMEVGAGEL